MNIAEYLLSHRDLNDPRVSQRMLETAATIRHDPADQLLIAIFKAAWPCAPRPTPGGGPGVRLPDSGRAS